MQLARTLIGAKSMRQSTRYLYMQPRGRSKQQIIAPRPAHQTMTSSCPSATLSDPQHASIARATSVHASRILLRRTWRPRRDGAGEQRRRKRDAHVTPFAQSDVDAKGPKPDHPTGPYAAGHDSGWR
jgi:hypothetical protein